ncbi:hypothetical protein IR083_05250 [Dysgonomonas sp. GY75]|uniref:hypothetical protein n=1 Tax=Dysgonomonas sp. GY75 TaxID=2780419 RepID=UPI00188378A3|nr:hypothetical protein [Dysgonomonas sp. GY75]MBF0648214.1 hypothetical protein [Dysgonomonas sp. GY75]
MNKYKIIIGIILSLILYACQDYDSVYTDTIIIGEEKYDGTLLKYLSDEADNALKHKFDSMLVIIDANPELKEKLANENEFYTIYALPNECFELSFKELNMYRTQKKLGKNISFSDLLINPFSVDDTTFVNIGNKVDTLIETRHYDYKSQVDTLMFRYIFEGEYTTEIIQKSEWNNITANSYKYKYSMNMECFFQNASGVAGGGIRKFVFSDMVNTQLKDKWKSTEVVHPDIHTQNGIIHILPKYHSFSYDNFISYFKNRGNE